MKKSIFSVILLLSFKLLVAQGNADGIKQYNYENYRTASKLFIAAIKQEATEGENYYYLGNCYAHLGKWDSAGMIFSQGVNAAPKFPQNFCGLAKVYLNNNNTAKALEEFQEAKSLVGKKDVYYYVWVADAYLNNNTPNTTEAINQLKEAIGINYKVAAVYMQLGDAYFLAQQGGEAISNYDLALQYEPSLIAAHSKTGIVWMYAQKYDQSLEAFQKALVIDPNYPPALKGLADLYYATHQYDKAKTTYEQYMKNGDMDDEGRYYYAQLLFLNKDYNGALKLVHDLMKRDSSKAIMFRIAAYSDFELGNTDYAYREITKFFALTDPKKVLSSDYEYQGKILQKKGSDSLAVLSYLKAVNMDTSKKSLYNDIAAMYYTAKKYKNAAKYYDIESKNISNPNQLLQVYYKLGLSYYLDSAYKKSDTAFMHIISISPTWYIGYLWRARANLNLDSLSHGPAVPYYQKLIQIIITDSVKYKYYIDNGKIDSIKNRKELIEAYSYIGNYFTSNEKYDDAEVYLKKVLDIDPTNTDIKSTLDSIEAYKKGLKKKPVKK